MAAMRAAMASKAAVAVVRRPLPLPPPAEEGPPKMRGRAMTIRRLKNKEQKKEAPVKRGAKSIADYFDGMLKKELVGLLKRPCFLLLFVAASDIFRLKWRSFFFFFFSLNTILLE